MSAVAVLARYRAEGFNLLAVPAAGGAPYPARSADVPAGAIDDYFYLDNPRAAEEVARWLADGWKL